MSRWTALRVVVGLVLIGAVLGSPTAARSRERSLAPATVTITASGTSPRTLQFRASLAAPSWQNADTVAHTVTFVNGLCTITIPPSGRDSCRNAFWRFVGLYRYRVSEVPEAEARVLVEPALRNVTIGASRLTIGRGGKVVLKGTLELQIYPPNPSGQAITILRRSRGEKRFVPIARVEPVEQGRAFQWQLVVQPRTTSTFRAQDLFQYRGGVTWTPARSRAITIRVLH